MPRVLVTGGAGFIGSNLVTALYEKGYEVTVLDNLSDQIHGADSKKSPLFLAIKEKVRFIEADVCDRKAMTEALNGQDLVVHLAAETGTGQSMYMVDHYSRVNIQATSMMLDILGSNTVRSVKRLVVASSRSIYGEGKYLAANGDSVYPGHRRKADMQEGRYDLYDQLTNEPLSPVPTDEDSLVHPSSVYGITKQVQEQLVMTVCPLLGIEPIALRYQNVYGPGQSLSNPYTGILSIFSNLIMQGKSINIFEDGLESRDFVYIDDVVNATMLALEHTNAPGNIFNVGSGERTSVCEVVDDLFEAFGVSTPAKITGEFRLGDIRHNYADLKRISSQLGYSPLVKFSDGIKRFGAWAETQGPRSSEYESSISELKERGMMHHKKIAE